jgi:hypothetical protein
VFLDYMLSWWFIVDVDSILGISHCVDEDSVADISNVHAASIFRVEMCTVDEFVYT